MYLSEFSCQNLVNQKLGATLQMRLKVILKVILTEEVGGVRGCNSAGGSILVTCQLNLTELQMLCKYVTRARNSHRLISVHGLRVHVLN